MNDSEPRLHSMPGINREMPLCTVHLNRLMKEVTQAGCSSDYFYDKERNLITIFLYDTDGVFFNFSSKLFRFKKDMNDFNYSCFSTTYNLPRLGKNRALCVDVFLSPPSTHIIVWSGNVDWKEVISAESGLLESDVLCLSLLGECASTTTVKLYMTSLICELMGNRVALIAHSLSSNVLGWLGVFLRAGISPKFVEEYTQTQETLLNSGNLIFREDLQKFLNLLQDICDLSFAVNEPNQGISSDYDSSFIQWFWNAAPKAAKDHVYSEMRNIAGSTYDNVTAEKR